MERVEVEGGREGAVEDVLLYLYGLKRD